VARGSKWQRRQVLGRIGTFHLSRAVDLGSCGEGIAEYTCEPGKATRVRGGVLRRAGCDRGTLVFRDPLSGRRIKSKLPVVRYEGSDLDEKRAIDRVARQAMQHADDGLARLRRLCRARPKKGWRK